MERQERDRGEFSDRLYVRWAVIETQRVWSGNLHRDLPGLQWPSVNTISGKWIPTVGLLVETIVNGAPVGPPRPFVFPALADSSLIEHRPMDPLSIEHRPVQMGAVAADGTDLPAPETVEHAPFELLIQRQFQDDLGAYSAADEVSHRVVNAFVFLRSSDDFDSAAVGEAAAVLKKIAESALGKLVRAGSFSNPVTGTLTFAGGRFTEALASAFREEADEDDDLLFELGETPTVIPTLDTLPPLPTTEPEEPGPFLELSDSRELVAIDTWDFVWHRPAPGPGNLVAATPDVQLRMQAEARCRLFVWRDRDE